VDIIISDFYSEMEKVSIEPYGIIDTSNHIHTLGTDSKIIGRVFEMYAQPVLELLANKHGYILATPESQTVYPDFILMKNKNSTDKIAIDIKTTYVESDHSVIKFTLGAFGSYMRNNTKNIEYKYTDYSKHYVIGFVYKRNGYAQESRVVDYENRDTIQFPFNCVRYFIQEKYKIAGDKPGSGNTENIGSFSTKRIEDLKNGHGPFSTLGADVFDIYWKYYPKYRSADKTYTSLPEFCSWFLKQKEGDIELLHPFDFNLARNRIIEFMKKSH